MLDIRFKMRYSIKVVAVWEAVEGATYYKFGLAATRDTHLRENLAI